VSMETHGPDARLRVLITGGAGFLGHALVRELLREDDPVLRPTLLRVLDLHPERLELPEPHTGTTRIELVTGDVRSFADVRRACQEIDLVLHAAALVDWGRQPDALLQQVNVGGTENVLRACVEAGVRALVHTSTLDVVYRGEPIEDGDESLSYPPHFVNTYCRTKADAERLVLAANDSEGELRTTVIRPCSIFGERDPYHVPPLLEMARRGLLFRVGNGKSRSQHVYVGNVAHAHLLAARSLLQRGQAAGEAYFVTDFPAQNFFDFLEPIVNAAGYRMLPWWLSIPRPVMYGLGCVLEGAAHLLRPVVRFNPTVTRFAADFVCLDFTFVSDKARRELGYAPVYDEEQAFARTIEYFRARNGGAPLECGAERAK